MGLEIRLEGVSNSRQLRTGQGNVPESEEEIDILG